MLIYLLSMIFFLYYYKLFKSKDSYSRDELKNSVPFIGQFFSIVFAEYSSSMVMLIFFISALIGLLPLLLISHWIINSALISCILHFAAPVLKNRYEETQVTVTDNYADSAISIFMRYSYIITVGISVGIASALIYNWAVFKLIHFLWFFINIAIVSAVTVMSMDKMSQ